MQKKILFINHAGKLGGATKSLIDVINVIDYERYSIDVACVDYPDDSVNAFLRTGKPVNVIPIHSRNLSIAHFSGGDSAFFSYPFLSSVYTALSSTSEIEGVIKKSNPDILMLNSMTTFWMGKIASKMPCKTVCWIRESFPKGMLGFRTSLIKKNLVKYFNGLIFISHYDMHLFDTYSEVKKVIYDTVDVNKFTEASKHREGYRKTHCLSDEKKYVLYLGGCVGFKGIDVVLEAAEIIQNPLIEFVLVGYGYQNLQGERKAKADSLEKKGKIHIFSETQEVEQYYAMCDMAIFPSLKAHQARIIYESWAAKIPVAVSRFENLEEFHTDSVYYFNPGDAVDLCSKIELALSNTSDKALTESYERAMQEHDIGCLKHEINSLFDECSK